MPGISIVKATVFTKIKGYCSQYQAVYNKLVELDDVPDTLIAKEQNKIVRQNVAYVGWADVYDIKYVLAQQYNAHGGALINWINPGTFDATHVPNGGALTFGSLEGLTGDGNAYLTTNYNPTDDGINFLKDYCSMGLYCRNNLQDDDNIFGSYDTNAPAKVSSIVLRDTSNQAVGRLSTASTVKGACTDSRGMTIAVRDAADNQCITGNNITDTCDPDVSSALATLDFFIFCINLNATPTGSVLYQLSCAFAGGALDATKRTITRIYLKLIWIITERV